MPTIPATEAAAMDAVRDAVAACTAGAGAIAHGNRNRALDALFELLTMREDGEQLTALATDADLVDIVAGRQTIAYVNARRR